MTGIITNITKHKKFIENLSGFLHDCSIAEYQQQQILLKFTVIRPYYESSTQIRRLGFVKAWKIPWIETGIEIGPLQQIEHKIEAPKFAKGFKYDWLLGIELNETNSTLTIIGVIHTHVLHYTSETRMLLNDIKKLNDKSQISFGISRYAKVNKILFSQIQAELEKEK